METDKPKRGRPRKEAPRVPLGVRITPDLRDNLVQAASNGRSIAQEAELRLEQSFRQQHLLDQVFDVAYRDPELIALLLQFGETMRDVVAVTTRAIGSPAWSENRWAFNQVASAVCVLLKAYRPEGQPSAPAEAQELPADVGKRMALSTMSRVTNYNHLPSIAELRAARERISEKKLALVRQRLPTGGPFYDVAGMPDPDPQSPTWRRFQKRRTTGKREINQ